MQLNIEVTEDNILDLLANLPIDIQQKALEHFTFDAVVLEIDKHLRGENHDFREWDTSGYISGSRLRDAIMKIQGLEQMFREDKESIIRSKNSDIANYKKYYDRMFELYHEGKIPNEYFPK